MPITYEIRLLREREDGPGRLIRPAPRAHGRPPQAVRRGLHRAGARAVPG